MLGDVELHKLAKRELLGLQREVSDLQLGLDLGPMDLLKMLVAKSLYNWHRLLELEDKLLEVLYRRASLRQVPFALENDFGLKCRLA